MADVAPKTSEEFARRKENQVTNKEHFNQFADVLLNDDYMEALVNKTAQASRKRQKKLQRYYLLNTIITYFLMGIGAFGLFLALLKTVLAPTTVKFFAEEVENVSLLILVDTSQHNTFRRAAQLDVIKGLSGQLDSAMINRRALRTAQLQTQLDEAYQAETINIPLPNRDVARALGSQLSLSVAVFNGVSTQLFDYTENFTATNESLEAAKTIGDYYGEVAEWYKAMEYCNEVGKEIGTVNGVKRYCVLFSDSDAMCGRKIDPQVAELCEAFPEECPDGIGESTMEYNDGIEQCTNFSQALSQEVIMMLTVGSEGEAQVAYKNDGFRSFVKGSTGCEIQGTETTWTNPATGKNRSDVRYSYQENSSECLTFVVAQSLDELSEKAQQLSEALASSETDPLVPGDEIDLNFLWFLLLLLAYPLFMAWVKIVKLITDVQMKTREAMGEKKKLVKVTKKLVEKDIKDDIMDSYKAQLEEVELSELVMSRPTMRCGTMVTLRARIKGTHLQENKDGGRPVNGYGKGAGRESCHWIFTPFGDESEADITVGTELKIKNASGQILWVTQDGTVTLSPDTDTANPSAEFIIVPVNPNEDRDSVHPGEHIRIKSVCSGKFLRVYKDGRVDATGLMKHMEGQLVIDVGGSALNRGSIVTIRAGIFKRFAKGLTDGSVTTASADDNEDDDEYTAALTTINNYRFWYMSYVKDPSVGVGAQMSDASGGGSSDEGEAITGSKSAVVSTRQKRLKVGDDIQLKSMDGKYLQADSTGELRATQKDFDSEDACVFRVARVGNAVTHYRDKYLRSGATLCLKKITRGPEDDDLRANMLRVNEEGGFATDGKLGDEDTNVMIEAANIVQVLDPVQKELAMGDMTILIQSPWDKTNMKRVDAQGSAWIKPQDLKKFEGQMVIATKAGTYKVPKNARDGWVCVMHEGVDIVAAAEKVKGQGGSGMVILTDQVFSMSRLGDAAARIDSRAKPVLPIVHIPQQFEKELGEKGLLIKGIEIRSKLVGELMTNLGKITAPDADSSQATQMVLTKTGEVIQALVQEHLKEVAAQREFDAKEKEKTRRAAEKEGKYKWKGDYAKAAERNRDNQKARSSKKGVKLTVAVMTQEDLMSGLDSMQGDFEMDGEGDLELEQLDEESDFRIEHIVQEIEVGLNTKLDDLQEEEDEEVLADQEGQNVGSIGVPKRFFWATVMILVLITVGLSVLIWSILSYQGRPWSDEEIRLVLRSPAGPPAPAPIAQAYHHATSKVIASTKAAMMNF